MSISAPRGGPHGIYKCRALPGALVLKDNLGCYSVAATPESMEDKDHGRCTA